MRESLARLAFDLARRPWAQVDVGWLGDEYEASQWLAPDRLRELQLAKLRPLVWHCVLFVPGLGGAILDRLGPRGVARLDDPARLPLGDPTRRSSAIPTPDAPPAEEVVTRRVAIRRRAERWGGDRQRIVDCPRSGVVLAACGEGGLHAQADHLLIEVVDDSGAPVRVGGRGTILLTDLHDYGAPRLREPWRSGRQLAEPCGCGRGLPCFAIAS